MKNTFGWIQLGASDPKVAKTFYSKLFDWSLMEKTMKDGSNTYIEIDAGEGPCAGIDQGENKDLSLWIPFVKVSDIHEYTTKAENLGAQIIIPITELKEWDGFYSVFRDPTGAVLGLWGKK